jgi:hypothetical protein
MVGKTGIFNFVLLLAVTARSHLSPQDDQDGLLVHEYFYIVNFFIKDA